MTFCYSLPFSSPFLSPVIHKHSPTHPCLPVSLFFLAFVLLSCSAACWLSEELVQSWLKLGQNANVSLCSGSVTHRGFASLCLFVCGCLCLAMAWLRGCVLPLDLWISKGNIFVCVCLFVADIPVCVCTCGCMCVWKCVYAWTWQGVC